MKRTVILLVFVSGIFIFKSQDTVIDSLKTALKNAKHDTDRCAVLNLLAEKASDEEWPLFNGQMQHICEKNLKVLSKDHPARKVYLEYYGAALNNSGYLCQQRGDIDKALQIYHQSLRIKEAAGDREGIAHTLINIGFIFNNRGDIPQTMFYYHKALKIEEEINDKAGAGTTLNNLGAIYKIQNDNVKAIEYFTKSLNIREEINDKAGMGYTLNNLGNVYYVLGQVNKALEYNLKSLKVRKEINDRRGIAASLNNIGSIYHNYGDPTCKLSKDECLRLSGTKALGYYEEAFKIFEEIGDKLGITQSLNNIAAEYVRQGKTKEAKALAERSLNNAKELGYPEAIRNASERLSFIYNKTGNYKAAYEMQVLFKQMADSVNNERNRKSAIQKDFQYAYAKKTAADSVKISEERKLFAVQMKQEKTLNNSLYIGIGMIAVFSAFMYNRFRITRKQKVIIETKNMEVEQQRLLADERREIAEKQKHIIEEKQKEILDSIYYARRIQRALITNEKYIEKKLKILNRS